MTRSIRRTYAINKPKSTPKAEREQRRKTEGKYYYEGIKAKDEEEYKYRKATGYTGELMDKEGKPKKIEQIKEEQATEQMTKQAEQTDKANTFQKEWETTLNTKILEGKSRETALKETAEEFKGWEYKPAGTTETPPTEETQPPVSEMTRKGVEFQESAERMEQYGEGEGERAAYKVTRPLAHGIALVFDPIKNIIGSITGTQRVISGLDGGGETKTLVSAAFLDTRTRVNGLFQRLREGDPTVSAADVKNAIQTLQEEVDDLHSRSKGESGWDVDYYKDYGLTIHAEVLKLQEEIDGWNQDLIDIKNANIIANAR